MPPNAAKALENVSLVGQNKTAVVVGGTLGMGAAVARLLAKIGCRRIIIFGRNATRGAEMLENLKKLAPKGSEIQVEFVKGDLADTKGMRASALALQEAAGPASIDYLVMCQSGVPNGHLDQLNADGLCPVLAVQAISRFTIAYLLTTGGALAPNSIVLSIANQGQSLDDMSIDDLSLKDRLATRSKTSFFMDQSKRDSTVLDSFHEELNIRYPQYRYFHMYPGLVSSENFDYNLFPGFLKYGAWLGMKLIGQTPDQFAPAAVYILAAPDAEKTLGPGKYFNWKLAPGKLGTWPQNPKNREALWEKLKEIIGEK
ncbi:hypothetical protein B0H11DRAFT_1849552 [Mycena galericulata]|nr:hypothetical protein B0H11DRAFT_1849552 [Mycena galericulata]